MTGYDHRRASPPRRAVRQLAATRPVAWVSARALHRVDLLVHRATHGRTTFSTVVSGLPVVMLTTTGARTGRSRTLPVLGIPDGDRVVVIASNFGQRHHPAWYHNLRALPFATVAGDGPAVAMRARELAGDERERYFAAGVAVNPGWTRYRGRAGHRRIPVIMLEPIKEARDA